MRRYSAVFDMDELLQQFLIESRELVDKAVDDLLALEKAPNDRQRFEDVFRGFHTLKGSAGIVEFAAMEKALHCAEDALAAARAESRQVSALDIGNCLSCLDQVVEWLDVVESSGGIPPDADAGDIVALFARGSAAPPVAAAAPPAVNDAWVKALLSMHAAVAPRAQAALRYRPDSDSFFRQEDPIARVAALPGLLAIDLEPTAPWAELDELDPFACNLTITALLARSPSDVSAALGDQSRYCDVNALSGRLDALEDESLARKAEELLVAQLRLLESTEDAHQHGRIAPAGVVAANVLRHAGRSAEADAVATAAAESTVEGRLNPLLAALGAAAHGRQPAGPAAAAVSHAEGRLQPVLEAFGAAAPGPQRGGAAAAETSAGRREDARQTMRVSAERIDALVRLAGGLVVSNIAMRHAVKLVEEEGSSLAVTLKNQHAVLNRLVAELQRAVVGMRVLPLSAAFRRFPRLIR